MTFIKKLHQLFKNPTLPSTSPRLHESLQLPCRADLWCRKRTSISTMLDPDLYALYMTNDDRIDDDWVIQSNPPCAFKAEFKEGCDALLALLQDDPSLHATKGFLSFIPPGEPPLDESAKASYLENMRFVVRTAERELKA